MNNSFCYITCPHCSGLVEVAEQEINCAIFRHSKCLGPHAGQSECERQAALKRPEDGCCKGFRLVKNSASGVWEAVRVDYNDRTISISQNDQILHDRTAQLQTAA